MPILLTPPDYFSVIGARGDDLLWTGYSSILKLQIRKRDTDGESFVRIYRDNSRDMVREASADFGWFSVATRIGINNLYSITYRKEFPKSTVFVGLEKGSFTSGWIAASHKFQNVKIHGFVDSNFAFGGWVVAKAGDFTFGVSTSLANKLCNKFDVAASYEKFDVAASYQKFDFLSLKRPRGPDFVLTAKLTEMGNRFSVNYVQKMNPNFVIVFPAYIGGEFQHSFSTKKNLLIVGGDIKISPLSVFKAKLDTEANINLQFGTIFPLDRTVGINLNFCVGSNLISSLPVVGFSFSIQPR